MNLSQFDTDVLYQQFITSAPYNHVVIDNFADPEYLKELLCEIKEFNDAITEEKKHQDRDSIVQNKKAGFSDIQRMPPRAKQFFEFANSSAMIEFIEKVTGIDKLLPDESFFGGGIHRTLQGGHLSIHADFNIHPYTQKHRRVNMLLYLNEHWKSGDNGELELWEKDMSCCAKKIPPIFNRAVIFRITDDAFHGHPLPWENPEPRLSLALYYYSTDRPESEKRESHMALWQYRTKDGF